MSIIGNNSIRIILMLCNQYTFSVMEALSHGNTDNNKSRFALETAVPKPFYFHLREYLNTSVVGSGLFYLYYSDAVWSLLGLILIYT